MNNYQKLAARTIKHNHAALANKDATLLCNAIGLAGEAGEVADKIKKIIFHGHKEDVSEIKKELGDVFWYNTALCTVLGLDIEDVMAENIKKLMVRYPGEYSDKDSIQRKDTSYVVDDEISQDGLENAGFRYIRNGCETMELYVRNETWVVVRFFVDIGTYMVSVQSSDSAVSLSAIKTMSSMMKLVNVLRGDM